MLARIVAETIELEIAYPIEGRVGELVGHVATRQVETRDVTVEPGGQTIFAVPQLKIRLAIGCERVGSPVGMCLEERRLDVQVVGNVVEHHVDVMVVRGAKHLVKFVGIAESFIDLGDVDGPVAMITREASARFRIESPDSVRVLRDGTHPDGVDTQIVEESFLNLLRDAYDIATLIIGLWKHKFRIVELPVILALSVVETVDHQRIEYLRLGIVAIELVGRSDDLAFLKRNEDVAHRRVGSSAINAQISAFTTISWHLGQSNHNLIVTNGHTLLGKQGVLPKGNNLLGFLCEADTYLAVACPRCVEVSIAGVEMTAILDHERQFLAFGQKVDGAERDFGSDKECAIGETIDCHTGPRNHGVELINRRKIISEIVLLIGSCHKDYTRTMFVARNLLDGKRLVAG